jgi:2',3'-cyclic-nucleotide 2'-phosphodiesterase (5'-nucleotidase family)
MKRYLAVSLSLALVTGLALAQNPETGADAAAQTASDLLREAAGSDMAFLAAGLLKSSYSKDDLATMLEFPTDEVVIVSLTGSQIKQALERSLQFYPQPNSSFLQLSGIEVTFNKSAAALNRVVNVSVGIGKLEETRTYSVAMPANLGRGALGYFKVWDKAKITKTLPQTMESILRGKKAGDSSPRWVSQG